MRTSKIRLLSLAFLATFLVASTASASDLLKERARWEWSLPESKNKDYVKGHKFTGWVSGGLTHGGEPGSAEGTRPKLGKWVMTSPGTISLEITDKDHPLHGTIVVKQ